MKPIKYLFILAITLVMLPIAQAHEPANVIIYVDGQQPRNSYNSAPAATYYVVPEGRSHHQSPTIIYRAPISPNQQYSDGDYRNIYHHGSRYHDRRDVQQQNQQEENNGDDASNEDDE